MEVMGEVGGGGGGGGGREGGQEGNPSLSEGILDLRVLYVVEECVMAVLVQGPDSLLSTLSPWWNFLGLASLVFGFSSSSVLSCPILLILVLFL